MSYSYLNFPGAQSSYLNVWNECMREWLSEIMKIWLGKFSDIKCLKGLLKCTHHDEISLEAEHLPPFAFEASDF